MSLRAAALAVFFFCLLPHGAAQTPPVPSQFQDAYNTVNADIASFNATVNANWTGAPSPVLVSSQLQTANSDLTTVLLGANYYQVVVLSELNSLQALGAKAITFHINFPALYAPYYSNSADYQAYLNFYTTLVNEIRGRGLKVIIENTIAIVYPGLNSGSFVPYYQSLDWPTYMAQRAQLAASIAQLFQPDYLVLVAEPDTEANSTGQSNANTVSGSTQMLQGMLLAIQATGSNNVQLSAGCGTWNPNFIPFIQSFDTLPRLNLVDIHIYPVNQNNLPNALTAAQMILTAGKKPSMSEFWTWKESDADYQANLPYTTVYARDVFSFWQATDSLFLQSIFNFANYGNFAFISPFWSHYYAAYLDYNTYAGQPDATLITTASAASSNANTIGAFTATGLAWEAIQVPAGDTAPPQVPSAPAISSVSQTGATIQWAATSDNVGVAAYNIYRDGAMVGAVSSPLSFYNPGLSPNTTYIYTIAAFDAVHNLSPQSAPLTVKTFAYPDKTPPSTPSGLQGTPFSDTQIDLVWNASTDNVAILGYEIYRGTTPSTVTPYATSPLNSFLDLVVGPSKTYYYQVDSYDTSGNHSLRSPVVAVTALADTTPPTEPTNVSVLVQAGPLGTVSWGASTDDFRVSGYNVYRGTSASNLSLTAWVAATNLSFLDTHMISGKTYYYQVAAVDTAKNQSALSPVVVVTAP